MNRTVDVASSLLASGLRLGLGLAATSVGPRPAEPIHLYEFEACPFCRKVREALTALDLEAMIFPCPKGGPTYRDDVVRKGGKAQFPYMVDPNSGEALYESSAIVRYLYDRYGEGPAPFVLATDVTVPLGSVASLARATRGGRYRPAKKPDQPLTLYSFEASPYCRIARERLCELEIPYRLVNVGKGSPSRPAFVARSGRMRVPYLVDPNTGREMFESADIARYLEDTYAR
ncbi:MAG: glutathione S-transferase N-terminal domain-containing protein [Polyangiales bacterium]